MDLDNYYVNNSILFGIIVYTIMPTFFFFWFLFHQSDVKYTNYCYKGSGKYNNLIWIYGREIIKTINLNQIRA